ncbi:hypothetical protein DZK25_10170 [Wenzhouxiangella sp. 15181]|nr:hypothetical protein DZK25_10170 [Wenzhouxiangella sp. 15181]RFP69471.1 hypothetical protein DZK26_03660 [Wenzhouxiangella sp. 15190]
MYRCLAVILIATLTACGGTQVRPYGEHYSPTLPGEVEVFYSFPHEEHNKIGAVDVKRYKPGFSKPTVYDAVEKLQEAGAELGAHAVVVVDSQNIDDRVIRVTAEAIRWPD